MNRGIIWWFIIIILAAMFVASVLSERASAEELYTVQAGDTLGTIASQHSMTWQALWELNKETVPNPNLVYVGQKLRVDGEPVKSKLLTRKEFEERVELLVMKVTYTSKVTVSDVQAIANAIGDIYNTDVDRAHMLTAIAWQETHFWKRRGKHGEVSIYQLMPATIRRHGGDPTLIENNVYAATRFASAHLTSLKTQHVTWERALYRWNWSQKYVREVLHKYYRVKGWCK